MNHDPDIFSWADQETRRRTDEAREAGMSQVERKAEDWFPGFKQEARRLVLAYLRANGPTAGEKLTLECKRAGIIPHGDRAFGPVYNSLKRDGFIVVAGHCRRERGHGSAGGLIWTINPKLPSA